MTSEDKGKIALTALLTCVGTIIAGLIVMSFTTVFEDKRNLDEKINSKVDKVEYKRDLEKKVDVAVFDQHIETEGELIRTMSNQIQFLYENEISKNK